MSVWAFVDGTARVRKDAHIGLKELIFKEFEHLECQADVFEVEELEREDSRVFNFRFSFSEDGVRAAKNVEWFLSEAKGIASFVDMNATIRFLG